MKPTAFSRFALLLACCLLGAAQPNPSSCEPGSPVAVDIANLDAAQSQLLALLRQHRPRYTGAEVEAARAAVDRCNTASADALNAIEVEKSGLSLRLSELLRYGDVVKLRERIETLRKNRESAVQELDRNLGSIRQVGLFAVLLEKVDIYAAPAALRAQAQAALGPRAVQDLNGVFVQRSTEAAELKAVKDIVRAYTGGEAAEDQVLFDRTNFEAGKDYYIYFAKISVRPLKKSPSGNAALPANAVVFNLDVDKSYQSALSARGVIGAHLAEISTRAGNYADIARRENEDAARRRDIILSAGQEQLRRTDRDIEDADRDLRTRAGKIETICRELGLPFSAANPDQSAAAAAQKLREQVAALEIRWNQTKEQEIQYTDTRVTIQDGPAESFAAEAVKLARKLEQQYGKVQKTEEITRVEDFKVTELNQSREVELYRRLRRLWVYPVGEADGTFRLYVFAAFSIAGRKEEVADNRTKKTEELVFQKRAIESIVLKMFAQYPGGNGAGVAYDETQRQYHTAYCGSSIYSTVVFDATGRKLSEKSLGFDVRGIWFDNNILQFNFYRGKTQPDPQSVGAFDKISQNIFYWHNGYIYTYQNDQLLDKIAIKFNDQQNLNNNALIYTNFPQQEIGLLNYVDKKVYLFNKNNGSHTGVILLPADAPMYSQFNFSFSNNLIWLFDQSNQQWHGYKVE